MLHDITGSWFDVPNFQIDHGIPTFALCGEVGLTAGPTVLGAAAIGSTPGSASPPTTTARRCSAPSATSGSSRSRSPTPTLEIHTNGYTRMHAKFDWGIDGLATLKGGLQFEMLAPKFNATAYVDACLDFVDWCAGARAIVSSKGLAVCLKIDVLFDDWTPGFGYRWGDALPTLYFSGCDVGDYKEHINSGIDEHIKAVPRRRATSRHRLPGRPAGRDDRRHRPGRAAEAHADRPEGRADHHARRPASRSMQAPFFVMKDPRAKLTQFAISKPSAGRWHVIVEPGSAP